MKIIPSNYGLALERAVRLEKFPAHLQPLGKRIAFGQERSGWIAAAWMTAGKRRDGLNDLANGSLEFGDILKSNRGRPLFVAAGYCLE